MRTLISALFFSLLFSYTSAQENTFSRNSSLTAGFLQIKESANIGLVFKGPAIYYGMDWNIKNDKSLITFGYDLGLGILFSREMPALAFYLKPVDFAYLFKIHAAGNDLHLGPSLKVEYNYSLFPELQSGFDYWFTNMSLGINARYDFNLANYSFQVKVESSLIGLTSRQPFYRDPHFYDLGIKYAIRHLNQDLTFGSFMRFNSGTLEILMKSKPESRLTFGYVLKYSEYSEAPEITMVSHNIKFIIAKRQK
ncbi:MAG: hypothetical protein WAL29_18160 [Bacteroidales bacterium]